MEKMLLTTAEVCDVTHLGETTIKALIARGEIESLLIGSARRIPADALEQWIARQRKLQARA